jgi:hypothetical protein
MVEWVSNMFDDPKPDESVVLSVAQFNKLIQFERAVLWHYNQVGHDRCHENDEEMYKRCGLPPRGKDDLPSEAEFEHKCKEYKKGLYNG